MIIFMFCTKREGNRFIKSLDTAHVKLKREKTCERKGDSCLQLKGKG